MKLIEKMAEEFIGPRPTCVGCSFVLTQESNYQLDLQAQAFEAGFRAAREMAATIEWNASANSEEYHAIKDLGESEVD